MYSSKEKLVKSQFVVMQQCCLTIFSCSSFGKLDSSKNTNQSAVGLHFLYTFFSPFNLNYYKMNLTFYFLHFVHIFYFLFIRTRLELAFLSCENLMAVYYIPKKKLSMFMQIAKSTRIYTWNQRQHVSCKSQISYRWINSMYSDIVIWEHPYTTSGYLWPFLSTHLPTDSDES